LKDLDPKVQWGRLYQASFTPTIGKEVILRGPMYSIKTDFDAPNMEEEGNMFS
jgi:hypothetical protein